MPCHCGKPGMEPETQFMGMCEHCYAFRCDAFPGACGYPLREFPWIYLLSSEH